MAVAVAAAVVAVIATVDVTDATTVAAVAIPAEEEASHATILVQMQSRNKTKQLGM